MNELIMNEKKRRTKRQKEKRNIRAPKKSISNQEMKEKIDELIALLFEETEKASTLKERKSDK